MEYETRITGYSIVPKGKGFDDATATRVMIEDDGGGEYVCIRQMGDDLVEHVVKVTCDDFRKINSAVLSLLREIADREGNANDAEPIPEIKAEPEYRYQYLEHGDMIKEGDEYREDGKWIRSGNAGFLVSYYDAEDKNYRRKIEAEAGPGYRYLKKGEKIMPGDEFRDDEDDEWELSSAFGCVVEEFDEAAKMYRRRIEAEPEPLYRYLHYGEAIVAGDEEKIDDTWKYSSALGFNVGKLAAEMNLYRRKIQ